MQRVNRFLDFFAGREERHEQATFWEEYYTAKEEDVGKTFYLEEGVQGLVTKTQEGLPVLVRRFPRVDGKVSAVEVRNGLGERLKILGERNGEAVLERNRNRIVWYTENHASYRYFDKELKRFEL